MVDPQIRATAENPRTDGRAIAPVGTLALAVRLAGRQPTDLRRRQWAEFLRIHALGAPAGAAEPGCRQDWASGR